MLLILSIIGMITAFIMLKHDTFTSYIILLVILLCFSVILALSITDKLIIH
jgi:hypothetical protein